jgi:tripartite-type tricarboxylate transporter receptor subunit TctC
LANLIVGSAHAPVCVCGLYFALAAHAVIAAELQWPTKPLRFIVPFPAGSSTDSAARLITPKLGAALGQQVIIDNRGGASGNIGVETAARSLPDGYTLVLGTASTHAVAASVNSRLAYDPVADFTPISLLCGSPYVLAIHPAVAANNVAELIAFARANPGKINYASAGNASLAHLGGELLATLAGVKFNHVPYKSSALAVVDLLSGRIELQFASMAPTLPHIRSGRLRALATTGAVRVGALPAVPTVAESSLAGYEVVLWMGILAPAATPAPIVARLNREVVALFNAPDLKEALIAQGLEPAGSTPAAFALRIRNEIAKWRRVAATAGVHAE